MVAYYAHSHGNGHLNSAKLFCDFIHCNTLIITSKVDNNESYQNRVAYITNEDTTPLEYSSAKLNLPKYAHYLRKSNPKILRRTKQILDLIIYENIRLALIDVSVETAIIFRISSIPYGYNLMPGSRTDEAHNITYDAAEFCYSFFPEKMFSNFSKKILEKTYFLGFHSRFKFSTTHCIVERKPILDGKSILIICGNGGTCITSDMIEELIEELPTCHIHSIGNIKTRSRKAENYHLGYINDIETTIQKHDIIISSCGMNLTSEILSIKNKFIAMAEERPYDEQLHIQSALIKNNLAVPFTLANLKECIATYLKLRPPADLENWFMNEESANSFKNKIKSYETSRHIVDYNFS